MEKERIYAVFGLGAFGYAVCKGLSEKGAKVIAVDNQEKKLNRIKNEVAQAVLIDTSDQEALTNAGLNDIDVAIVAIGDNIDTSILTTTILREMGIPVVISRAVNLIHAKVLKKVGATEVIFIEVEQGERLANRLYAPYIMSFHPISQNYSIAEIVTPKKFEDKSLKELDLRKRYNVNIILIQRKTVKINYTGSQSESMQEILPTPNEVLKASDLLIIFGSEEDISKLRD
jgi:trk system potassium uptake protein TrkA